MPLRLRYWIYGALIAAAAIGIGLFSSYQLDFDWAVVSVLLLAIASVVILSNRYQRRRPNLPQAPVQAGTTLVNAAAAGQDSRPSRAPHVPPEDRYTWLAQPSLAALPAIILISVLF